MSALPSEPPQRFDRLFLAVWPPPPVRDALQAHAGSWQWPRSARLVPPEKLHMTLHFIGNVPVQREAELSECLSASFEPFELQLTATALWGSGIAVLCARECPLALGDLHAQLAQSLIGLDLPVEQRPFRPHVTLARHAKGAIRPARTPPIAWVADQGYALMRSLPGGRGYETVKSWP